MTVLAQCLFCDDIREEASGQFTMVGIYGPYARIRCAELHSLYAVVAVIVSMDHQEHFELVARHDGQEIERSIPPDKALATSFENARTAGFGLLSVAARMRLPAITVDKASEVVVSLVIPEGELVVGKILLSPPQKKERKRTKRTA